MNESRYGERDKKIDLSSRQSWLKPGVSAACIGASLCIQGLAHAQSPTISGEFSAQHFDPAPGPRNFIVTRTARSDGKNTWSAGLIFDYAANPFTVQVCDAANGCAGSSGSYQDVHVIKSMATGHVLASFTPRPQLQLGLSLPVTSVSGEGLGRASLAGVKTSTSGVAFGDPMLEAKYRLLGKVDSPLAGALAGFVTAPTAAQMAKDKYIGNSSVTGGLRAIADLQLRSFTVAGNLVGVIAKFNIAS